MDNMSKLVAQLAQASGAELTYKSDQSCIEVFGTERAVRNVYQMLYDMPFLKVCSAGADDSYYSRRTNHFSW